VDNSVDSTPKVIHPSAKLTMGDVVILADFPIGRLKGCNLVIVISWIKQQLPVVYGTIS
jgi:hypothetical protein